MRSHLHEKTDRLDVLMIQEEEEEHRGGLGFVWEEGELGEGWAAWPHPTMLGQEKKPPTMKAYYPTLLMRFGNPDTMEPIAQWELPFILKMRLHSNSGRLTKFAGVREVGTWLGLETGVMQRIRIAFPCSGVIDRRLGKTEQEWVGHGQKPNLMDFGPCGTRRFCENCAIVLKAFGNSWNQRVAAEQIYKTLLAYILGATQFDFAKVAVHKCGD
jgi:hypothetical protein